MKNNKCNKYSYKKKFKSTYPNQTSMTTFMKPKVRKLTFIQYKIDEVSILLQFHLHPKFLILQG